MSQDISVQGCNDIQHKRFELKNLCVKDVYNSEQQTLRCSTQGCFDIRSYRFRKKTYVSIGQQWTANSVIQCTYCNDISVQGYNDIWCQRFGPNNICIKGVYNSEQRIMWYQCTVLSWYLRLKAYTKNHMWEGRNWITR